MRCILVVSMLGMIDGEVVVDPNLVVGPTVVGGKPCFCRKVIKKRQVQRVCYFAEMQIGSG